MEAKKKLAILIPSYKRPEVLDLTLSGIFDNLEDLYDVSLNVALNKASNKEIEVTDKYKEKALDKKIAFNVLIERVNIGKAQALNKLFLSYILDQLTLKDYIITLDNDMLLKKKWMHLIKSVENLDFDLMGFSSILFWCHLPERKFCKGNFYKDRYILYPLSSIAGGMMLFPYSFLKQHKWTNFGGVYGEDDATMCTIAKKKYVLAWDEDWLQHDPLMNSTDILRNYQKKKEKLYSQKKYVFPLGWDE